MNLGPVGRFLRSVRPGRETWKADLMAGLPGAVGGVPDGMAAGVLAGVSPVHGLYASFAGRIAGGLSSSSRLMVITTTSAAALAAGSAAKDLPANERAAGVVLMALVAGAAMIAAGVLRLGRYTRFVSHSVMIGFLTGISLNILFGQLADLTGTVPVGSVAIAKAWHVITHPGLISLPSLAVGLSAIAILVLSVRTRWAQWGAVVALVVPTVVASLFSADIETVKQNGTIPAGLPRPDWPVLHVFDPQLLLAALAIAAIVLVQGVGVAEAAPNPDGSRSDTNRDFIAQGVGNVAAGAFVGMPVGASVGQTALNRTSGARTRWAAIFSGVWLLLILVLFSGLVGKVLMPTLAGVLIVAAVNSIRVDELLSILRASRSSAIATSTTLVATLILPVTQAVGIGVALSLILQLNLEAVDLRLVRLVPDGDGLREVAGPAELESNAVVLFDVYGSVLYAGARTLQARLPNPAGLEHPVVVLRMRGRTAVGVTFMVVIDNYLSQLERVGGRLYLSGVGPEVIQAMGDPRFIGRSVECFERQPRLGDSSLAAVRAAEAWLDTQK